MNQTELVSAINSLKDDQAERCLQVLVKGYAVRHGVEEVFVSEAILLDVISTYHKLILEHKQKEYPLPTAGTKGSQGPPAPELPPTSTPRPEVTDPKARGATARDLLKAMAEDDELRPRIESWFESNRPTLVDPITGALVLGGIVLILSTDIDIEVKKDKDGKTSWKVRLKKAPTKESLLGKFFGLFGFGGSGQKQEGGKR